MYPDRRTLLVALLLFSPTATLAASGEISVFGTQISGDFGSGADSDRQTTLLRYVMGDTTQLRFDLELARVRWSGDDFVNTPLGPVPTRGRGPQGSQGQGPGSGGAPGQAPGGNGLPSSEIPGDAPVAEAAVPDSDWRSGLGDLRFGVSQLLLGGGAKIYRLDAAVGVKAPTGDETDGLGTGEWDYRVGLAGQYRFWSATAFGGLGWNVLGDPEWVELADVPDGYVGVESELLGDRWVVSGWVEGNGEVVEGTGSRTALAVGVRSAGKLRWRAQVTAGLGGAAEDLSVLVGCSYGVKLPVIGTRTIR